MVGKYIISFIDVDSAIYTDRSIIIGIFVSNKMLSRKGYKLTRYYTGAELV
jgi:hypothetical protein